jgi:hypothetical protein
MHVPEEGRFYGFCFPKRRQFSGRVLFCARGMGRANSKVELRTKTTQPKSNNEFMRKLLLGLIAVAAVLLPLSQNAQAHWGYYHHYYGGYHQAYWHHRYWHGGFWYGGYWHPGYWYPSPVMVVAPY